MARARPETRRCEELLGAISSAKGHARDAAMKALQRWIEEGPDFGFGRKIDAAKMATEPRFASALDDVAAFCMPGILVAVPVADIAKWWITAPMWAALIAKLDPDDKLMTELMSSMDPIRAAAQEELKSWFEKHPNDVARAKRLLTLAAKRPSGLASRKAAVAVCVPILVRELRPRDVFPPEHDEVLEVFAADEELVLSVLERMPMERRTRRFELALARGAYHGITPRMLALASEEIVARVTELEAKKKQEREAERKAEEATKFARTNAPFRFVDPVRVLPKDYAALDDVKKAQYRATAGGYVASGKVRGPKDFIRQLKKDDLDESDAELQRWKVMRGAKHVYDLWVVWVENGMFFLAGKKTQVPVYMVQGSYLPRDDKPASKQLAVDLGNSERGIPWLAPKQKRRRNKS